MKLIKISLLLLMCLSAWAQSHPPGPNGISPNNSWPLSGYVKTDDEFVIKACRWIVGTNIPIVGNSVALTSYTTQYSGYHAHEISLQGRPQAIIETEWVTSTGADGCAAWTVAIPGLAGWYTFEATFNATCQGNQCYPSGVKGENLYAREVAKDDSGPFIAYPDNELLNAPQSSLVDANHENPTTGNGLSRYMVQTVIPSLARGSSDYENQAVDVGIVSQANVFRISLPDGGLADNQSYTYGAADWETQRWEEHARGTEVDIINPNSSQFPTLASLLVDEFAGDGCVLGIFQPDTLNRLSNKKLYWINLGVMHFSCASSPLTQRAPGKAF